MLYACITNGWFENLIGGLYIKNRCFDTLNNEPYVMIEGQFDRFNGVL